MANLEAACQRYPLPVEAIKKFIRPGIGPPLVPQEIDIGLFPRDFQKEFPIKTPTTGDGSLLLKYKGHEVAVASWNTPDEDLNLLQLQGARSKKSYRGTKGFDWVRFMSQETEAIAHIPDTGIRRITMPPIERIPGLEDSCSLSDAISRYEQFRRLTKLDWSEEERLFVRDVR